MLETRDLYNDYISSIKAKIDAVSIKIGQYHGSQEYLRNCIINNRAKFEELDIDIDNLFANPYIAYAKIKQIVDNGQLTRVAHYVKSYVNSLRYLTLHKLLFDRYNKCLMPYEAYLKLLGCSNFEIAKHIVKGGYYTFGNVGKLYVREKARTFLFKGRPVKQPIDWGLSNKYKAELIEQGKVPYDQNSAPHGVKWHIYHDSDYAYWFWWEAGAIQNRGFFKFFPSSFINYKDRKNNTFLTTCKSEDDIINSTKIGNLDKILMLMKFNPLYYLNYRRSEKMKEVHHYDFINI